MQYNKEILEKYLIENIYFVNDCILYLASRQTPEELRLCKTIDKNDVGFSKDWAYAGTRLNEWITGILPWNPDCCNGYQKKGRRVKDYPLQAIYSPKRLDQMTEYIKAGRLKDLNNCIMKHRAKDAVELGRWIAIYHWSQLEDLYFENRKKDEQNRIEREEEKQRRLNSEHEGRMRYLQRQEEEKRYAEEEKERKRIKDIEERAQYEAEKAKGRSEFLQQCKIKEEEAAARRIEKEKERMKTSEAEEAERQRLRTSENEGYISYLQKQNADKNAEIIELKEQIDHLKSVYWKLLKDSEKLHETCRQQNVMIHKHNEEILQTKEICKSDTNLAVREANEKWRKIVYAVIANALFFILMYIALLA